MPLRASRLLSAGRLRRPGGVRLAGLRAEGGRSRALRRKEPRGSRQERWKARLCAPALNAKPQGRPPPARTVCTNTAGSHAARVYGTACRLPVTAFCTAQQTQDTLYITLHPRR